MDVLLNMDILFQGSPVGLLALKFQSNHRNCVTVCYLLTFSKLKIFLLYNKYNGTISQCYADYMR